MVKNLSANVGDAGLTPGLGSSPGEGNGNPLQYSCLGNPMDRGFWWATVHGVTKSQARLSNGTTTDPLANRAISLTFQRNRKKKGQSLSVPFPAELQKDSPGNGGPY